MGTNVCMDVYSFSFVPEMHVVKFYSSMYIEISRSNYLLIVLVLLVSTLKITHQKLLTYGEKRVSTPFA